MFPNTGKESTSTIRTTVSETAVSFADEKTGRELLTVVDGFVAILSPFDLAARVGMQGRISREEYLRHVGASVLEFDEEERKDLAVAVARLSGKLEKSKMRLPGTINLVKTTGQEEGNVPYTRGDSIVIPEMMLGVGADALFEILSHELFHVFTRNNPDVRDRLYSILGFSNVGEIPYPEEIRARRITNPDAHTNCHVLELELHGARAAVIPVLFSREREYDPAVALSVFAYLEFALLVVEKAEGGWRAKTTPDGPAIVPVSDAPGYLEAVGDNTAYILHPEEVLADNFKLLVAGAEVPTPRIPDEMRRILF